MSLSPTVVYDNEEATLYVRRNNGDTIRIYVKNGIIEVSAPYQDWKIDLIKSTADAERSDPTQQDKKES